ncbi:MAG: DNA replication/repair protein RecF [Halofilum sp. (in: g-proteobacteria)]
MHLTALDVRDLRVVASAALEPDPGLNLITGANAAGKTSLLEAIHVLSTGRSFAATRPARLVRHGGGPLRVVGRIVDAHGRVHRLGVERERTGVARMRLDGANAGQVADLARLLPVIAVHPESHDLVGGGPDERRRLLDLGLFHVEHDFHSVWRRYRRALAQRNAVLRGAGGGEFKPWEQELAAAGEALDASRRHYVDRLAATVLPMKDELLKEEPGLELGYQRGWPEGVTLYEALVAERARQRDVVSTGVGPHRADLTIRLNGREARQQVSRGQQKLLVYLLRLGQARQLAHSDVGGCVLLLDDVGAELDEVRRGRVTDLASRVGAQVFLTALEPGAVPRPAGVSARVFHVEQGAVHEMV